MAGNSTIQSSSAELSSSNNNFAFAVMTSLFFIWAFITALNDILIPQLKAAFDLSYTQAMLIQFCFFGAYLVVSPFAGRLIEKIGYLAGIITGLLLIAAGCLLFYPAAEIEVYGLFLFGLFVLAAGITILQVSANPYVAILGPERTATSRLNLAQAINSLGHTLGPLFGAILIFGAVQGEVSGAKAVQLPYLILAAVTILVAVGFKFLNLPAIEPETTKLSPKDSSESIWSQKHLVFGAAAIFLYVGAEVAVGSFLVNYFSMSNIGAMSEEQAGKMVSYYWFAAMVGRFIGAALTRVIRPSLVLGFNGLMAILLLIVTMSTEGQLAVWSVIGVGLFNSIMFPTIFTLAIRGLGPLTSRGSGLLCQAIFGGALVPLLQGFVADTYGLQISFIVPALAYPYIIWYALYGSKPSTDKSVAN